MEQRPYDKKKIGRLIGWGGEHVIFEYEGGRVIKFSWHVWLSRKWGVRKLLKDYAIGEKYFSKYLLPTDIRVWDKSHLAVEFQEKVTCRTLTKDDLKNPIILAQVKEIFALHTQMRKDIGKSLDFFGFKGLMGRLSHYEISNIKILPGDRVTILDFTIMDIKPQWFELPLLWFIQWSQRRQRYLFNKYWSEVMRGL